MRVTKELIDSAWDKVFDNVTNVRIVKFDPNTETHIFDGSKGVRNAILFQLEKTEVTEEDGTIIAIFNRVIHVRNKTAVVGDTLTIAVNDQLVDFVTGQTYRVTKAQLQSWGTRYRCETELIGNPTI